MCKGLSLYVHSIHLNTTSPMHLKSIALSLTISALPVFAATAQETTRLDTSTRKQVVDSLSRALMNNYVYPDKAEAISLGIQKRLEKGAYDHVPDKPQLAAELTKDVRELHPDKHLAVRFDPDLEERIKRFVASPQPDKADVERDRRQNFHFKKVEILPGNIGYLVFDGFAGVNEQSKRTVRAAMEFVANADALILDLRNNTGGRPEMGREIARHFFSRPQPVGKTYSRITDSWTEEWIGHNPEGPGGLHLEMPVYILTSERTYSAAEGLAYNLKHLKRAVLVGDTTRGGAHATRSFALGNGFVGFIPFSRYENAVTGTDWEGTGVVPSTAVTEEHAALKAQELILTERLASAKEAPEQRRLQWLLNDLRAKGGKITVSGKILAEYTGTYEEFQFTLENGSLFCRNLHRKDKKDKLVPINVALFRIDDESQVEFVRDEDGRISSIRLLWNDGWVDAIRKSL